MVLKLCMHYLLSLLKLAIPCFHSQYVWDRTQETVFNKLLGQFQSWNNTISRSHHSMEMGMKNNNNAVNKNRKTKHKQISFQEL